MIDAEALVFVVDDDACIWGSSKHPCAALGFPLLM
jgi:hypothetical protein